MRLSLKLRTSRTGDTYLSLGGDRRLFPLLMESAIAALFALMVHLFSMVISLGGRSSSMAHPVYCWLNTRIKGHRQAALASMLLLMILFMTTVAAAEMADPTVAFLDDAIVEMGFDTAQKSDLEAGAIISVGLPSAERQANEIMVGAAMMLVRRPLSVVTDSLIGDDSFRVNANILDFRPLSGGNLARDRLDTIFDDIGYTEAENDEVSSLLNIDRDDEFNFSDEEITRFRSIRGFDDELRAKVSKLLADVLRQRMLAYQKGGLASVEPYTRGNKKVASPRQELEGAFVSLKIIKKHFPNFFASLTGFPRQPAKGISSDFYWIKRIAVERPAYVLSHRMVEQTDNYSVAMELQYYVQHSYNSMLTLVACVPVEGGTLVLSAVRLFTDQVTGFASSTRKKIGRKRLAEAMTEYFDEVRQVLEN